MADVQELPSPEEGEDERSKRLAVEATGKRIIQESVDRKPQTQERVGEQAASGQEGQSPAAEPDSEELAKLLLGTKLRRSPPSEASSKRGEEREEALRGPGRNWPSRCERPA
jgi:hypothetical protein